MSRSTNLSPDKPLKSRDCLTYFGEMVLANLGVLTSVFVQKLLSEKLLIAHAHIAFFRFLVLNQMFLTCTLKGEPVFFLSFEAVFLEYAAVFAKSLGH